MYEFRQENKQVHLFLGISFSHISQQKQMIRVTSLPHICQDLAPGEAHLTAQVCSGNYGTYSYVTLGKSLCPSSHRAIICQAITTSQVCGKIKRENTGKALCGMLRGI